MAHTRHWTHWLILGVGAITVLSGVIQFLMPEAALVFMGIGPSDEAIFLLRLVSLFTALFGGALTHTALISRYEPTVLFWAGLQKIAGAGAMLLGVSSGLLAAGVLLVAGYDFAAGVYVLWFHNRGRIGNG